ncbi:MAG: dockerin type I repeat-containing protein [Planctomycetota bacterium]
MSTSSGSSLCAQAIVLESSTGEEVISFPQRRAKDSEERESNRVDFDVPRFDPDLGTLESARFEFTVTAAPYFSAFDALPSQHSINANLRATTTLIAPGLSPAPCIEIYWNETRNFDNDNSIEIRYPARSEDAGPASVSEDWLSRYTGAGNVSIRLQSDFIEGMFHSGNATHFAFAITMLRTLRVVYRYRGPSIPILRADANGDGAVDVSDPIALLHWLFLGGKPTSCYDAADANDDGKIDLSDAVFALDALFQGGPLSPGWGTCSEDVTEDALDCADSICAV